MSGRKRTLQERQRAADMFCFLKSYGAHSDISPATNWRKQKKNSIVKENTQDGEGGVRTQTLGRFSVGKEQNNAVITALKLDNCKNSDYNNFICIFSPEFSLTQITKKGDRNQ